MATRTSKPAPKFDFTELRERFKNYLQIKDRVKKLTGQLEGPEGHRTYLNEVVDENGHTDEKGNLFLDLDVPIEFQGDKFVALKREKRSTQSFDPEVAEAVLRKNGLWGEPFVVMVPEIDQEALRVAFFEKKIKASEFDRCFPVSFNYALFPVKGD